MERFRTQDTGHRTTGYEPRHFADLTNSTRIYGIIDTVTEEYRQTRSVYRQQDGRIDSDHD